MDATKQGKSIQIKNERNFSKVYIPQKNFLL